MFFLHYAALSHIFQKRKNLCILTCHIHGILFSVGFREVSKHCLWFLLSDSQPCLMELSFRAVNKGVITFAVIKFVDLCADSCWSYVGVLVMF